MTESQSCQACGTALAAENRFCPSCGASRDGTMSGAATVASVESMDRITTSRLSDATTGEFEILQRIGHGAMGSVYLARDVSLSRRVAIKVISPQLLQDESMVARFRLEAQTVASLRHPHIVNLHAVRELGDLHYFVMDFIDGPSLRSLMKQHGPLDIPIAQALLFQIGSALSYAHRRGAGVIHRDVKPANVMVDGEGNAIVMDFGISKVGAVQSGLTQTGATIGTPEYMSPEQCMDKELTGASDQYALGIMAYEMLTGAVPFKGSTYGIMMAHVEGTPPPIRESRQDCPPEVEAAVMRMIAKEPEDRFDDVEDAVTAMGGAPLGSRDPVRDSIVAMVTAVSGGAGEIDASSPLSPVPSAGGAQATVMTPQPASAAPPAATPTPAGTVVEPPSPSAEAPPAAASAPAEAAVAQRPQSRRAWVGAAAAAVLLFGAWRVFGAPAGATPGEEPATDTPVETPSEVVAEAPAEQDDPPPTNDDPPAVTDDPPVDQTPDPEPADTEPQVDEPTRPALDLDRPMVPDEPAVGSVRIVGGNRAMRVGTSAPVSVSVLNTVGEAVADPVVAWSSSAGRVASVDGSTLVANGSGEATITASVDRVEGSMVVRVLDLPTRDEAVAMTQRVMDMLRRTDGAALERLMGGAAGRGERRREILARMRAPSFEARLMGVDNIGPDGEGARYDFAIGTTWRDDVGARQQGEMRFRATAEPTMQGWRLSDVNRLGG